MNVNVHHYAEGQAVPQQTPRIVNGDPDAQLTNQERNHAGSHCQDPHSPTIPQLNGVERMLLFKIEQTAGRDYRLSWKKIFVQITNRLLYWLLDRYFERTVAFLDRQPAKALPNLPPDTKQDGSKKLLPDSRV